MKKTKEVVIVKMTNQERFEHWMKEIIFNKHRCNFKAMDRAMQKIIN